MNRRMAALLPGVMAGALFLAACGGGGTTSGGGTKTGGDAKAQAGKVAATVNMPSGTNKYQPDTVTVKAGEAVKWVNTDSQVHDVKFQSGPSSPSVMNAGAEWQRTFDTAGSFPYVCTYHEAEGMKGTVTVQ
ncbi:MAG TPA: plastocyanin/azurin family copper-binding protein [Dehalococcoidia bacterium]|nr:plastocyanin/azurin family copper-binding protein [Dehalococcoidia bacterium]